ncbi:hypothetical protein CTAYLR_007189 [Chrysophaeum taylorii]|uniref:Uncharacterized protein n=1 Tax=Chrysophaeum taylorii TaxID=2483200 RepID=A0AAD7UL68_9STRA|nr:hypothetical protein CTAYLR_007189 [Chrysophaeum taylorii]
MFGNSLKGQIETKRLPTSLTHLDLSHNNLSGPLPASIGALRKLRGLFLERNDLSGCLPDSLGDLRFLEILKLNHNDFEGRLPSLGGCRNLTTLWLHQNPKLAGDLPVALAALATVYLTHTKVKTTPATLQHFISKGCNLQLGGGLEED